MPTCTVKQAVKFVEESHGVIFAIKFIKRTTGELREMNCRTDVTSKLKGGEANYDREEYKLLLVYDMQKQDYRTVPIEGITEIKMGGEWHEIARPAPKKKEKK